jgi:DNA-binding response OmpR family regulator
VSNQKKILILDDDPDILLMLSVTLEDVGYTVSTLEQGHPFQYCQEHELPDLILLDMVLSDSDGRIIARELKQQPLTQHIPILMLSAQPDAEKEARAAGADDFLAKPFEIEALLACVRAYVS